MHRHRVEELADILGIVVHAAVKLGVSMAEVEAAEIEKLGQRFTVPEPRNSAVDQPDPS